MFLPHCIAVPANRASRCGLRPRRDSRALITGTNVNTMVVPGFVAQSTPSFRPAVVMPCHEYCGLGHSEMWATVQVLPNDQFKPGPDGRISCAQR
jgi:cytochrome c oxidase subunit 2